MNNGILPLNEDTLIMLEQKHPEPKEAIDKVLLTEPLQRIHPIVYDVIDEDMVLKAATVTKGGSGPSGLDGDGWRRILCSTAFGTTNTDLRKAVAEMIKKLYIYDLSLDGINSTSIEAFTAENIATTLHNHILYTANVNQYIQGFFCFHKIRPPISVPREFHAGEYPGEENGNNKKTKKFKQPLSNFET